MQYIYTQYEYFFFYVEHKTDANFKLSGDGVLLYCIYSYVNQAKVIAFFRYK